MCLGPEVEWIVSVTETAIDNRNQCFYCNSYNFYKIVSLFIPNCKIGHVLFSFLQFNWDPVAQSQVIGAFFYGYLVAQVPGGRLAEIYGAKRLFGISLGSIALLNLLMPVASRALPPDDFPWIVVIVRILMGVFGASVCFYIVIQHAHVDQIAALGEDCTNEYGHVRM